MIFPKIRIGWLATIAYLVFSFTSVMAAPGNLANSPLFTTNSVEPNVFFEVDDSGSMDWEILTKSHWRICSYNDDVGVCNGSKATNGLHYIHSGSNWRSFEYIFDNDDDAYTNKCDDGDRETLESCSADVANDDWRVKSSSINVLYYNPTTSYLPWVNADGSLMANANFSTARSDPQINSAGYIELRNLASDRLGLGFVYNVWTDSHGFTGSSPRTNDPDRTVGANGHVDWWDEQLRYTVNVSSITVETITYTDSFDGSGYIDDVTETISSAVTLSGTGAHALLGGRTVAETQQNIANWYQYSRRRSFVTKSAIASVVADNPDYRYGLNFINNSSFPYDGSSTNFVEVPASNATITENMALISGLNSLNWPAMGTPLRLGLERAGKYFDNTDSRVDPINEQCQQNFSVLFTDGYWNGNSPSSSIGNADGDGYSITVADVAKYYYDNDLSPFPDNVVGNVFDPAPHQHMVTYTVAFGVKGALIDTDSDGWPGNAPGLLESDDWGDAFISDSPEKIDDLWHAAYNSRGTFVAAETPGNVSQALGAALSNISDRIGSAASVAFNTTTLTGSSAVYLAQFNSSNNKWSGDLLSFPLDPITGNVSTTPNWTAATVLEATVSPETTRKIFTYNGTDGTPFSWGTLTATQKADFKINPDNSVSDDTKAEARLDFIRGDRANEEGQSGPYSFRSRSKLLGDIVHSDPVFVGAPELSWPEISPFPSATNETYSDFKLGAAKDREPVVYVGSNDGMLHGFKASDGAEVMAYISNSFYSSSSATEGLHYLTDPNYTHRYYTDMPSTISDVYIDSNDGNSDSWHTILIGGGRGGSRGLFALDITDPTNFVENTTKAANLVLWEFNQDNDSDMGYTYSKPSIVMMNNDRWAAVFGNGYNGTGDGEAKLFILFLDGGLDGVWTDGSAGSDLDYIKITTGVGSIISADCSNASSNCNGLSTPQLVDLNGDKVADRAYAGDLQGNMWAFDLTTANEGTWDIAYKQGGTAKPLFTATNASLPQPITNKPILVKHPDGLGGDPDLLVFFGTGQYLTNSDITNTNLQAFYGVWDNGSHSLTPTNLVEQEFISGTFTSDGSDVSNQVRVLTENTVNYSASDHGWKINLTLASGERVIVDPDVRGDLVFFNTWIPDANPCNAGGSGVLMSVNQINGGSPSSPAFDLNNDGVVDILDMVTWTDAHGVVHTTAPSGESFDSGLPASSSFLSNKQYTPGTDGGQTIDERDVEDLSDSESGRISWHELGR